VRVAGKTFKTKVEMKHLRFSANTRVLFFSITYVYLLIHRIVEISKPVPELIDSTPAQGRVNSPELRRPLDKPCKPCVSPVPELIELTPLQRRVNSPELRLTLGKRIDADVASNHGLSDNESHFDFQDMLLKMSSHSIPFKYEKSVRMSYTTTHQSVSQGSFVIEPVMALLTYLTRVQDAMQIRGDIGEIGVHHGKFFVGLGHLQKVNEKLWACDVFENQKKNTDGSGFGNRDAFQKACRKNGIKDKDVHIHAGSSLELMSLKPFSFRLFSIDGGHSRILTVNDLTLAANHLVSGGVLILDDVLNFAWPGVIDGFFTWLHYFPVDFAPFFVGYNKVFVVESSFHELYYQSLRKYALSAPPGMELSVEPFTNMNPHKSKESGLNEYLWNGYRYVHGDNSVNIEVAKSQWEKELLIV